MSETAKRPQAKGGCLCSAVTYEVFGPMRQVINCHCGQCRRTHGHFAGYSNVRRDDFVLTEERGLKWYESSDVARRGFCGECGGSLFYDRRIGDTISIAAGTLNEPSGLKTVAHIFMADKGDYYEIDDGLKTYPGTQTKA